MAEDAHNPMNQDQPFQAPASPPAAPESSPEPDVVDTLPADQQAELDGFIDQYLPPGDEVAGDDGSDDTTQAEAAPPSQPSAAAETPTSAPSAPSDPAPEPAPDTVQPTYRIGDQLLTAQQIIEQGYFNDIIARAAQQPAQQPAQEPATQQQITSESLRQAYEPMVDSLVQQGYLTADFVDTNPQEAAGFAYLVQQHQQMAALLDQIYPYIAQQARTQQTSGIEQTLTDGMQDVAARGEIYQDLQRPEKQQEFRQWLIDYLNPTIGQLTPDFLARAYIMHSYEALQQAANGTPAAPATTPPDNVALASAEQGSARVGTEPPAPTEPWADLLEGYLPTA